MKIIFCIVILITIVYIYSEKRINKFRDQLTIGTNVSYFENLKRIRGKITSIKRNKLNKITFVFIGDTIVHVNNIYK